MAHDGQIHPADPILLPDLLALTARATEALDAFLSRATAAVAARVTVDGRPDPARMDAAQPATHGLAWLATYAQALRRMQDWATRLEAEGEFGEIEALIHQIAFGEYLGQVHGGLPMSQGEILRPQDMGLMPEDRRGLMIPAVLLLCEAGNSQDARTRLIALIRDATTATFGNPRQDAELDMIRDQFRRWTRERIAPHAHGWHLRDALIP